MNDKAATSPLPARASMDIARPSQARARRKRRIVGGSVAAFVLVGAIILLARLQPAAPAVDRSLVWIDTVKRGPMVRQVRGIGTLVPEEIRWISSRTSGRVERVRLHPGAQVEEDSVILILSSPSVEQAARSAESQLKAAEAELASLRVQLEREVLAAEAALASAKADYEQARLKAELNEELFKSGLTASLDYRLSKVTAEQAETRYAIEQKRFAFSKDSIGPQLLVKKSDVDRLQAEAQLRRDEFDALSIRAGVRGVLQVLSVEVGAQVAPGANLARVADPARLKAEIRIPETQTRDVQIGQLAVVDTRNGLIQGKVARVDPSVRNGTVTVDVSLVGELPRGVRPDLSVDGTIELERLPDVVFVGRPAFGQEQGRTAIFKLDAEGRHAVRTPIKLGRSSVNTIEILDGLRPDDRVIISDMSQWDTHDRIKLH